MNQRTLPLISPLVLALGLAAPASALAQYGDDDGGDRGAFRLDPEERQGPVLGVDIGPNFVIVDDDISDDSAGIGFAGRAGYRITADILEVTPEVKLGFESPGTPNSFQAMGGAVIGLGTIVSPIAFGHVGGLLGDLEGLVWDAGGGVRLNLEEVSIGLEGSYNRAEDQRLDFDGINPAGGDEAWEWVRANATLTLSL